jgi:hypothetical protein
VLAEELEGVEKKLLTEGAVTGPTIGANDVVEDVVSEAVDSAAMDWPLSYPSRLSTPALRLLKSSQPPPNARRKLKPMHCVSDWQSEEHASTEPPVVVLIRFVVSRFPTVTTARRAWLKVTTKPLITVLLGVAAVVVALPVAVADVVVKGGLVVNNEVDAVSDVVTDVDVEAAESIGAVVETLSELAGAEVDPETIEPRALV